MRTRLSTRIQSQNPATANVAALPGTQNDPGQNVQPPDGQNPAGLNVQPPRWYTVLPVDDSPYSGLDLDAALAD